MSGSRKRSELKRERKLMKEVERMVRDKMKRRRHRRRKLTSESEVSDSSSSSRVGYGRRSSSGSSRGSSRYSSTESISSTRNKHRRRRSSSRSPLSKRRRRDSSQKRDSTSRNGADEYQVSPKSKALAEHQLNFNPEKQGSTPVFPPQKDTEVSTTVVTSQKETKEGELTHSQEENLGKEMLDIIGQPLTEERQLAEPVHSKLASRWDEVLRLGLPKKEKGELLKKYPPPSNCTFLDPPKLNPEIVLSLNESCKNRDTRIVQKQEKLQACMSALAQAITSMMSMKGDNHVPIIEWLSNTARLVMDTMHDKMERWSLILANVNSAIKDALASSKADEKYLFGSNLSDTLKQAQATNKDVQVIAKKRASVAVQSPKNPKGPTRHSSKTSTSAYGQQRSGRKNQRDHERRSSQSKVSQRSAQKSSYGRTYPKKR
ncbi:unnamed protein product [Trichogramma brassicae]|uniref:Uncharacterized protein n=1 Tax=Trichogramma brassicae TaxID=86971 RepID=A0A6H5IK18_9HYME|nr:unnamed protein product [Trichogramma brassicae]